MYASFDFVVSGLVCHPLFRKVLIGGGGLYLLCLCVRVGLGNRPTGYMLTSFGFSFIKLGCIL